MSLPKTNKKRVKIAVHEIGVFSEKIATNVWVGPNGSHSVHLSTLLVLVGVSGECLVRGTLQQVKTGSIYKISPFLLVTCFLLVESISP